MCEAMNYSNVAKLFLSKRNVVHLVLKHKYYNAIDDNDKKIEYRDNTAFWRKRIIGKRYVTFHKGYTNVTMTFKISKIEVDEDSEMILIYLGERINV